jgi:hypothetical protein
VSPQTEPTVSLDYLQSLRASDLPSAKKGGVAEISSNSSAAIETRGNDEAWLVFHAKAQVRYVLSTRALQSDVDTVIEVYDRTENERLQEDDDGGEDSGGESSSSRLVLKPGSDMVYHIRIKNIDRGAGSFVFEVSELP